MDFGSIFLILGLLILVVIFISQPFFEKRSAEVSQTEQDLSALLAERDRILNALQELDFDFALGKIPEAEYPVQRAALVQRGADILRRIDELQPQTVEENAEERLEAAIASRRADAGRVPAAAMGNGGVASMSAIRPAPLVVGQDDDLETLIASRRRDRKEKAAGFCPQCGGTVQKSDRFCPKCGQKIA
jgi:hypothetical protein